MNRGIKVLQTLALPLGYGTEKMIAFIEEKKSFNKQSEKNPPARFSVDTISHPFAVVNLSKQLFLKNLKKK